MKVFKFGGASVKDAAGVRNLASIVGEYDEKLVIVVSAMGKTTNALEVLTKNYFNGDLKGIVLNFNKVKQYHFEIITELFPDLPDAKIQEVESIFV